MIHSRCPRRVSLALPSIVVLVLSVGCGTRVTTTVTRSSTPKANPDESPPAAATEQSQPTRQSDVAAHADSVKTSAKREQQAASGGTLRGRVRFDGPKPKPRPINMSKDATCVKLHGDDPVLSEELLVGDDGGVQNVFVYIRRGAPKKDYPIPDDVVVLDQKDCMYRPRVQGMLVGQTLRVLNDDPVTHNVRSFPIRNRAFNYGQPAGSGPRERTFESPEREIEIQCDIHPWMHAYLFVMDHPFFAVTDQNGDYTISGLPAGKYSLAIWHESLGKQQQDVTVADRDVEAVNFAFKP